MSVPMTGTRFLGVRCSQFAIALTCLLATTAVADHPSVAIGLGVARPINTESAVPLGRGDVGLALRTDYLELREFSAARLNGLRRRNPIADVHSVDALLRISASVAYGLTDDLTVGLQLPFIRRTGVREPADLPVVAPVTAAHTIGSAPHTSTVSGSGVLELGSPDGLGDLSLLAQYRALERGRAHLAILGGLKMPTGRTDLRSGGERIEAEFQPGSGSWDTTLGLAFTWLDEAVSFDVSALYTIVTEGTQDTDLGDVFTYGVGAARRVFGRADAGHGHDAHEHTDHDHGLAHLAADVMLELGGEWRDRHAHDGHAEGNSGGSLLFLSPGVRFVIAERISLALSVGIPIAEDLDGDQVVPDYRLVSSLGWTF